MSPQPQAAVGAPVSCLDGHVKVIGAAKYAADHDIHAVVHTVIVDSGVGWRRVTGLDTHEAQGRPGVLKVITHRSAPRLAYRDDPDSSDPPGELLRA